VRHCRRNPFPRAERRGARSLRPSKRDFVRRTALDFLEDEEKSNVRIADAPFLEGACARRDPGEPGSSLPEVFETAKAPATFENSDERF
jgi:hypothetical protein